MIAVVGGGVIGLSVAYYLSQGGAEVVLYERDMLGRGCTWGGAGWISPSESAPVIGPQAIRQALLLLPRPARRRRCLPAQHSIPACTAGCSRPCAPAIPPPPPGASGRWRLQPPHFRALRRAQARRTRRRHDVARTAARLRPQQAGRPVAGVGGGHAPLRLQGTDDLLTGTELRNLNPPCPGGPRRATSSARNATSTRPG